MKKKLGYSERQLLLEKITFYSICSEEDRKKILGQVEISFKDFRRLSLLMDYLNLTHLHSFLWEMHGYKFLDKMEEIYQKCEENAPSIEEMLMETAHWLDDFSKQAPNEAVEALLHTLFLNGLDKTSHLAEH